jgi:hypothetical protein
MAGDGSPCGLDLSAGKPARLFSLEAKVAENERTAACPQALHAAAVHLSVFRSFGLKHFVQPLCQDLDSLVCVSGLRPKDILPTDRVRTTSSVGNTSPR